MTDKIILSQMSFYGYHGALPEENKIGQRFLVDAELEADLYAAGASDSLEQTINYAEVYGLVRDIVEGPVFKLIEAVAERIAEELLNTYSQAASCRIRVIKPDPPIAGHYESVAVEIERKRSTSYLGLGSNIDDREGFLKKALEALNTTKNTKVSRCSSIYETDPYGPIEQNNFLNMAVQIETLLPPEALLDEIRRIEQGLMRKRDVHWGPRTIDLDILLFDHYKINTEKLSLPHPEIKRRAFVLKPLADIAPHVVVPGINRSVIELWQGLNDKEGVRIWRKNNGEGKFGLFEN
ncbi:2-amino-4-hydroxy-6-hydroxymethyldihydropteridine diphosphokinase [Sporolactobacillus shoreae]|uniref:Bifunctional folate synthesis protein n=1 Tax=Sporolactobacillus shoreae TaxID=1465501 RepID=A0A4Z0GIB6_9BACL|nr:2-amino-4-hydroxy-6-hydroxymethyldihydropteridine diphosphokinase [Sporolactobacillus shoreae]